MTDFFNASGTGSPRLSPGMYRNKGIKETVVCCQDKLLVKASITDTSKDRLKLECTDRLKQASAKLKRYCDMLIIGGACPGVRSSNAGNIRALT